MRKAGCSLVLDSWGCRSQGGDLAWVGLECHNTHAGLRGTAASGPRTLQQGLRYSSRCGQKIKQLESRRGHVLQYPIAGDANGCLRQWKQRPFIHLM